MLQTVLNGKPTRNQVEKLFARVKAMKDGEQLSHLEIETVIGEKRGTFRYSTILNTGRRRILNELGCVLISERGVGYRRANGFEQVRFGVGSISAGVRKIAKGVQYAAAVSDDRLPDGQHRKMRDHVVERATYLAQLAKVNRKELSLTVGKPELMPK